MKTENESPIVNRPKPKKMMGPVEYAIFLFLAITLTIADLTMAINLLVR